jgi:hypothetical protein
VVGVPEVTLHMQQGELAPSGAGPASGDWRALGPLAFGRMHKWRARRWLPGRRSCLHAIAQASRPVPSRRKHKPQSVVGHSRVAARALSGVLPTRLKAVARWRFGHGMTGRPRAADWPVAGCRLARFRVPTDRSCRSAGYVEIARAVGPSRWVPPPRCLRAGARRQRDQLCESLVPPARYRVCNLINGTIVYIDGRTAPMSYEHFPVLIGCLRSLSSLGSRAAQQGRRCALALSYECLGGSTRSQ